MKHMEGELEFAQTPMICHKGVPSFALIRYLLVIHIHISTGHCLDANTIFDGEHQADRNVQYRAPEKRRVQW